jgi:hypothetical protein
VPELEVERAGLDHLEVRQVGDDLQERLHGDVPAFLEDPELGARDTGQLRQLHLGQAVLDPRLADLLVEAHEKRG